MDDLSSTQAIDQRIIRLSTADNVAAAAVTIEAGETVVVEGTTIRVADRIPTGHKLAIVAIAAGEKVLKYGAPIGSAIRDIRPGDYVHTHNLASDYLPTYTRESRSTR